MFSQTLQIAVPYAQELEASRIRLGIPSGSALGCLMSYSSADNPQALEPVGQFIGRVNNVTIMEGALTEHEGTLLTMVDELAPLVQSHLRVAREVGQIATELADNVRRYVESVPAKDASGEFNIVKDEVPGIFEEASVLALIERSVGMPPRQMSGNLVSGARDFDTLLSYMMTGNSRLDQRVKEMVAVYDSSWLENIWYGFFASTIGLPSGYSHGSLASLPSGERMAVAYVCYSIANKLLSDTPKDAIGSLSTFENSVADLRDYCISVMGGALNERKNHLNDKIVALGYRPHQRTAIVNGPVYREWLETGGSPELLLGSLLSGNPAYSVSDFSERGDEFQRQWDGFCVFHNAESDVRRSGFLRGIYLTCFTESMGKIAPFEEEFRASQPAFAEKALAQAELFLQSVGMVQLSDLKTICLELTAGIRFDYTPSKMILKDIDEACKASPDVNIREAALVAGVNYMAQYLAGLIGIVTV